MVSVTVLAPGAIFTLCRLCAPACAVCRCRQTRQVQWHMLANSSIRMTSQHHGRRFLQDLPPGLHEMNDHLLHAAFPPEVQPVQEIMQILQARTQRRPDTAAG